MSAARAGRDKCPRQPVVCEAPVRTDSRRAPVLSRTVFQVCSCCSIGYMAAVARFRCSDRDEARRRPARL